MKVLAALIVAISPLTHCFAQVPVKFVHAGVSATAYRGDLSGFERWSSAFHLGLKLNQNQRINSNFNFSFGNVSGQDINYEFNSDQGPATPNRFFRTDFFTFNYDAQFNIIKKENIILYLSQGVGLFIFSPEDQFFNKLIDQQNTREEGETYSRTALMLPTQIGVIYFFPNHFGIGFNIGILNTQGDYIDNISEWGLDTGNDNIIWAKFSFYVPFDFKDLGLIKEKKKRM